jgi:DNA-directed RNA polymerase
MNNNINNINKDKIINNINNIRKEIMSYKEIDPLMYIGGEDVEKIYQIKINELNEELNLCFKKLELLEINEEKKELLKKLGEKSERNEKEINKNDLIIISCFSEFSMIKDKEKTKSIHRILKYTTKNENKENIRKELEKFKRVNYISNANIFLTDIHMLKNTLLNKLFQEKENLKDEIERLKTDKNKDCLTEEGNILTVKVLKSASENLFIKRIIIVENKLNKDNTIPNFLFKFNDNEIELIYISLEEYCRYLRSHLYKEFDFSLYKENKFLKTLILSKFINEKLYLLNKKIKNSVVIFRGYSWEDIIYCFKSNKLMISGGSNNIKHLINPIEYRLSVFINYFFGNKKGYNYVVNSLYKMPKLYYRSKESDLKNKEIIIDEIKPYDEIKNESFTINIRNLDYLVESEFVNEYCDNYFKNLDIGNDLDIISLEYKDKNNIDYNISFEEISDIFKDSNNNIDNFNYNNKKEGNLSSNSLLFSNKNNKEIGSRKYHNRRYSTLNTIVNNSQEILDNKIKTEIEILNKSYYRSLLTTKIKSLIDNIKINTEDKKKESIQIEIENLLLDHETQYLNNLIKEIEISNSNVLSRQIIRDWESKLNSLIKEINHPYKINNYNKLRIEIEKNNVKGILQLLILSIETSIKQTDNGYKNEFYTGKLINVIFKLIIHLFSEETENKMKKSTLIMRVMGLILKRVPKIFPILSLNDEDPFFWEKKYNELILNMSEESKISIGSSILDLILEQVDIFEQSSPIYDKKTNKRHNYISIKTDYINDLIDRCFNPLILPMVSKPKDWVSEINSNTNLIKFKNGGYYTEEMRRVLTTKSFLHHNSKLLKQSEETIVQQKTINFINKQKFRINSLMLEFLMKEFNDVNSIIFKGFNYLKKVPILKNKRTPEEEENLKLILAHNSRYFLNKRILDLAYIFQNVEFYIPVFMDFRGRIYPYPSGLEYQGTSIARSLIEFSDGCQITEKNERFIYQYLANTAGKSKLTIANKEKWSNQFLASLNIDYNKNCDLLVNNKLFKHPKVLEILNNNDEAPLFIACLISLIRVKFNNNNKFHTPICFDATCSGLQHLSALFSDVEMGIKSNVIASEFPQDLYTEVGNTVISTITNLQDSNLRNVLSKIKINRKFMKKPVMTVPYNVGINTLGEQLVDNNFVTKSWESLDEGKTCYYIVNPEFVIGEDKLILTNKEMGIFSVILHQAIYKRFPSLKIYKNFLDDLIKTLLKLEKNDNLFWITPSGLKINISYRNYGSIYRSKNILTRTKGGSSISLPQMSLSYRTNLQAFMPNFIHSMDAANIHLLIKNLQEKNINLYTIHDCFATTPNYMELINKEIKLAFINLYFDSQYIKLMYENFFAQISSKIDILEEDENGITKKFFLKYKDGGENEKIYIPNFPDIINKNWDENKDIFIEGIRKSLYFIN